MIWENLSNQLYSLVHTIRNQIECGFYFSFRCYIPFLCLTFLFDGCFVMLGVCIHHPLMFPFKKLFSKVLSSYQTQSVELQLCCFYVSFVYQMMGPLEARRMLSLCLYLQCLLQQLEFIKDSEFFLGIDFFLICVVINITSVNIV